MTTQRIKGLTQPLPPNTVIGRLGNGGAPQVLTFAQIAAAVARSGQVASPTSLNNVLALRNGDGGLIYDLLGQIIGVPQ